MNYLAHAHLSFHDSGVLVGNMISDHVKGKKKFDYPNPIQQGITLHRIIDTYTDGHPATNEAKEFFRPHYRLYSGAFVDVIYDHFLALDEEEFPGSRLFDFSQEVYAGLSDYKQWLPERFGAMLPSMIMHNWLYNYRTMGGIEKSLQGVAYRAAYIHESHTAFLLFEKHYQPLRECYRQFWADAKPYTWKQYEAIKDTFSAR
ncbi:MAG: DUF479 domain-containing protein [Chitinophagaceae bacterium]|nr:DUF479 domain-containing protein [Chitinophagaceae bacterium]